MKKKIYVPISVLFFVFSISVFLYALYTIGLFDKNKILVKALACSTCANYEVVVGGFKLSGKVPDSIKELNSSEVFIEGTPNPYLADYTKTYDYYIITCKVTGVKKPNLTDPPNPVVSVLSWQHIYISSLWPMAVSTIVTLFFSIFFHRKYINANRMSILKTSLMVHEDEADES